jgi:uncharacterized protein YaiL (DUF2058 family)
VGESLKDQLLALGLAKPETGRRTRGKAGGAKVGAGARSGKQTRAKGGSGKSARQRRGRAGGAGPGGEPSLDQAWRLRAQAERQETERAKGAKLAEERRRRQINGELQALVDEHAVNVPDAELKRNFIYKGRIRSVPVTREQLAALNDGSLGLVFLKGRYYLVPPAVARQAAELSAEHVPDLNAGVEADPEEEEHPVPDDLIW